MYIFLISKRVTILKMSKHSILYFLILFNLLIQSQSYGYDSSCEFESLEATFNSIYKHVSNVSMLGVYEKELRTIDRAITAGYKAESAFSIKSYKSEEDTLKINSVRIGIIKCLTKLSNIQTWLGYYRGAKTSLNKAEKFYVKLIDDSERKEIKKLVDMALETYKTHLVLYNRYNSHVTMNEIYNSELVMKASNIHLFFANLNEEAWVWNGNKWRDTNGRHRSYLINTNHHKEKLDSAIIKYKESRKNSDKLTVMLKINIAYTMTELAFMQTINASGIILTQVDYISKKHMDVMNILSSIEDDFNISNYHQILINRIKAHIYYNLSILHKSAAEASFVFPSNGTNINTGTSKHRHTNLSNKYLDKMYNICSKKNMSNSSEYGLNLELYMCLSEKIQRRNKSDKRLMELIDRRREIQISNLSFIYSIGDLKNKKKSEDSLTKQYLEKVRKQRNRLLGTLLLITLITIYLNRRFRLIHKYKDDKGTSNLKQAIIEISALKKQIETEQIRVTKYRRAMSHRIKNGLGGISSRLDLIKANLPTTEDNGNAESVIKEIKSRVNTMLELHTLLNQKVDAPFIDLKDFIGKMRTIYNMYNDYEVGNYHFETIDFSLPLRPEIVQDIGLIIDELISNAWVHSRSDPRYLKILILKKDEKLIIEVQDAENIYNKNKEIIYDRSTKNKLRKASDESQKSKGHTIITNIARRYKGTFGRICNDDGIGSNYFVHFNINNLDYE